jgi:hypothetical protein
LFNCIHATGSNKRGQKHPAGNEVLNDEKSRKAKQLMLTKAQFNIDEVEHYGVEENSLDYLRKAGCMNILVLLRDHDRGLIRVACDLPEGVTHPNQLKLECASL